jgi:uncharacterized membrane protein YbhN (UPF0104 family)
VIRRGALLRLFAGAAVLAVVGWRVGGGPFLAGLRSITGWSLAAATGIGLVTTTCGATRWRVVARGLGVEIPLATAVAAYYRSQFLNTVLPGGVVGDVHRGVRQGRDSGGVGNGLRAVGWERVAGQAVQVAAAIVVLLTFPSPVRSWAPVAVAVAVGVGAAVYVVAALTARALPRVRRVLASDVRAALLSRRNWPTIVAVSAIAVVGHAATFLLAAHVVGSAASAATMLPLTFVVLLAMAVPLNVGGWGPREGVAAWVFASAGLGATQGVATATVYGVLAFAACLPGLAVLVNDWVRAASRRRPMGKRQTWLTARTPC